MLHCSNYSTDNYRADFRTHITQTETGNLNYNILSNTHIANFSIPEPLWEPDPDQMMTPQPKKGQLQDLLEGQDFVKWNIHFQKQKNILTN